MRTRCLFALAACLTMFIVWQRPVSAHAPLGCTSTANAWCSVIPHDHSARIQLMNSLRGYENMVTDYYNAIGHLNQETQCCTVGSPPYVDNLPGDPQNPDVWIVEAGSSDENTLNFYFGFSACSSSTAWGKVYAVNLWGSGSHWHTILQKICIWPSRFSRTGTNGQGLRYQYLTLQHESAHVLHLDHPTDSHGALMRDGASMLELNTYERDGIRNHY